MAQVQAPTDEDLGARFSTLTTGGATPSAGATPSPSEPDFGARFSALAPEQPKDGTTPQYSGVLREPLLGLKALGQGAAELVTLPGDVIKFINGSASIGPPIDFGKKLGTHQFGFPTTEDVAPITNALGLTSTPQLEPQGWKEGLGAAGVKAIPLAAATVATGGGLLMGAGTVEAGALSGEAAHRAAPNNPWLPAVAGIVGAIGAGGLIHKLQTSYKAVASTKALIAAEALLKHAEDAMHFGSHDAGTAATQAQRASEAKVAAVRELGDAAKETAQAETRNQFETVAGTLGESTTHQEAGEGLRTAANLWLHDTTPGASSFPNQLEAAWAPVNAAIPGTMELPLSDFVKTLKRVNESAGELEPLNQMMKQRLPAQLWGRLTAMAEKDAGGTLDSPEGPFKWKDVRTLRSTLGSIMSDPVAVRDVGAQNAADLYRALTLDLRVGADKAGATRLFDQANAESSRLYDIAQGPIAKVINPDRAPESVASALFSSGKKGATDLATLRQEVPGAVNELAAANLRMGTTWTKLSPEAREALIPDETLRARLDSAAGLELSAKESSAAELAQAKSDHEALVQATRDDLREGNHNRSTALRKAREARDLAKANVPEPTPPLTNLSNVVTAGTGAALGWNFAPALLNQLEINPHPMASVALGAAGLALPLAYRGAKAAVRDPSLLRIPAVGAAAGSNALSLPPGTPRHN